MRARVTHALRELDAIAVENSVLPGTPDVEYINGWIELKSAEDWPAREETPLSVPHFSKEQRAWLRRRCRRGGKAWVLLRVKREWLLFSGAVAADILGIATRAQLLAVVERWWRTTPSDADLLAAFNHASTESRRVD